MNLTLKVLFYCAETRSVRFLSMYASTLERFKYALSTLREYHFLNFSI